MNLAELSFIKRLSVAHLLLLKIFCLSTWRQEGVWNGAGLAEFPAMVFCSAIWPLWDSGSLNFSH